MFADVHCAAIIPLHEDDAWWKKNTEIEQSDPAAWSKNNENLKSRLGNDADHFDYSDEDGNDFDEDNRNDDATGDNIPKSEKNNFPIGQIINKAGSEGEEDNQSHENEFKVFVERNAVTAALESKVENSTQAHNPFRDNNKKVSSNQIDESEIKRNEKKAKKKHDAYKNLENNQSFNVKQKKNGSAYENNKTGANDLENKDFKKEDMSDEETVQPIISKQNSNRVHSDNDVKKKKSTKIAKENEENEISHDEASLNSPNKRILENDEINEKTDFAKMPLVSDQTLGFTLSDKEKKRKKRESRDALSNFCNEPDDTIGSPPEPSGSASGELCIPKPKKSKERKKQNKCAGT